MASRLRISGVVLSLLIGAGFLMASPTEATVMAGSSADPAPPAETTTEFDWKTLYSEFAQLKGISVGEAERAFVDSKPLYDFVVSNASDDRFGALWVTYEGGYEIHARYLDESFAALVDNLAKTVGASIERHTGGASNAQLMRAVDLLRAADTPTAFEVNHPAGTIDFLGDPAVSVSDFIQPEFARRLPAREPGVGESTAGADFQFYNGSSWQAVCTVGFMWGSSTTRGYSLAAHCPDPNNGTGFTNGLYTENPGSVFNETCPATSDHQFQRFGYVYNLSEYVFDKRTYPHPTLSFSIAGGYYSGQPTLKSGLYANGATGSNTGTVNGFAGYTYAPGGDCTGTHTVTGLQYNNLSKGGDSGGPVLLSYGGSWFLAATHVAGPSPGGSAGTRLGIWVPWITLPSGAHICQVSNPCN